MSGAQNGVSSLPGSDIYVRDLFVGRTCLQVSSSVEWMRRRIAGYQSPVAAPGNVRRIPVRFEEAASYVSKQTRINLGEYHRLQRDGDVFHCHPFAAVEVSQTQWYYRHLLPLAQAVSAVTGDLLLHCGCVVVDGVGPILLAGARGAGKSTTCAALAAAGFTVVTDDLVCISPADHNDAFAITAQAPELHIPRNVAKLLTFIDEPELRPDYLPGTGRIAVRSAELPYAAATVMSEGPLLIFVLAAESRGAFEAVEMTEFADRAKACWRIWLKDPSLCSSDELSRLTTFAEDTINKSRMWRVSSTPDFSTPGAVGAFLVGLRRAVEGGRT